MHVMGTQEAVVEVCTMLLSLFGGVSCVLQPCGTVGGGPRLECADRLEFPQEISRVNKNVSEFWLFALLF